MRFHYRPFSSQKFLIPFGRFRFDRKNNDEAAEILVGRESQRAFLIDSLIGAGQRGAYLVTGRRGVGKTTFVESCLEEYEASVFRRFLRSRSGRSPIDILIPTLLMLGFLFVLLTASDLLEFVTPQLSSNPLLIIILSVSIIPLSLPILYAAHTFRQVSFALWPKAPKLTAIFLFGSSVYTCIFYFPAGSPAYSSSLFLTSLAVLVGLISFLSYRRKPWGLPGTWVLTCFGLLIFFFTAFLIDSWVSRAIESGGVIGKVWFTWFVVQGGFISGPIIVFTLLFSQIVFYFVFSFDHFFGWISNSRTTHKPHLRKDLALTMCRRLLSAVLIGLCLTGLAAVVVDKLLPELPQEGWQWLKAWLVFSAVISVMLGVCRWILYRWPEHRRNFSAKRFRFVPPCECLLILKGFAAVMVSLQLLYPLSQTLPAVLNETDSSLVRSGLDNAQNLTLRSPGHIDSKLVDDSDSVQIAHQETGDVGTSSRDTKSIKVFLSVFNSDSDDEILWFTFTFIICVVIYFLEYEWINRPFISHRQSLALDRGSRRDYQPHHNQDPAWFEEAGLLKRQSKELILLQRDRARLFRALESATMPFFVARFWLPALYVRINLGFDKLDHRGVTHAMLYGLRRAYRSAFWSWQSPTFILGRATLALVLLYLAVLAGRVIFDLPYRAKAYNGDDLVSILEREAFTGVFGAPLSEKAVDGADVFSQIDHCRWLTLVEADNSALLPVADWQGQALLPRISCDVAPDFTNTFLPLLFAPLLNVPIEPHLDPNVPIRHSSRSDCYLGKEECFWSEKGPTFRPIYWMTHINNGLPSVTEISGEFFATQERSISFRLYHFITFIILFYISSSIGKNFSLLPFRNTISLIDDLAKDLVESHSARSRPGRYSLRRFFGQVLSEDTEIEQKRDRLDPRTIELAMLHVLEGLQERNQRSIFGTAFEFSVPAPEVHFVFDELDKIGGVVGADDTAYGVGERERMAVDAERQRTYALHALLSDMKRVISSAPARFIFVGGRALHDEWVRDINRSGTRQPLLSGIFDAEIYLPSLLLDLPQPIFDNSGLLVENSELEKRLDARVREYLEQIYEAAKRLDESLLRSRLIPFFALPVRPQNANEAKFHDATYLDASDHSRIQVVNWRMGDWMPDSPGEMPNGKDHKNWLLDDFCRYLAYRSGGSPKKLRELLSMLIRPSGSFSQPGMLRRFELLGDRDMIVIDARELYRIQFVGSVFKHIDTNFGDSLAARDDKVALNVLFLFDYLMKLHDRAFSVASLERLDELAHIHRAPDLRRLLDKVVNASAEAYFHRLLNGLYSLRFQSDLAMEIRYLSRISEPEMAALNFTLDESQELKTTYSEMQDAAGEPNSDIVSALGELYEYDQAYDVARGHYERALRMVDEELVRQIGDLDEAPPKLESKEASGVVAAIQEIARQGGFAGKRSVIDLILRGTFDDRKIVAYFIPWAVRRLRLMMQIGLTFEQIGDIERAQTQYYSAHMLSRAITDVAFAPRQDSTESRRAWSDNVWLKLLLENLTLIYQPLMSSAWMSEKLDGSVDTSIFMVEQELTDISRRFDFVQNRSATSGFVIGSIDAKTGDPKATAGYDGENFSLIAAELHNKAGDLYFFKGRDNLSMYPGAEIEDLMNLILGKDYHSEALENPNDFQARQTLKSYLPSAHSNYAIALHSIRRFAFFRRRMSSARLNKVNAQSVTSQRSERAETHRRNHWPSFVNLAAASSLVDLSETLLAGQTSVLLCDDLSNKENRDFNRILNTRSPASVHLKALNKWFESPNSRSNSTSTADKLIDRILGQWENVIFSSDPQKERGSIQPSLRQVSFHGEPDRPATCFAAILLGYAGADFTRRAGYSRASMGEYESVVSHVSRIIKNILVLSRMENFLSSTHRKNIEYSNLIELGAKTAHFIGVLSELVQHILAERVTPTLRTQPDWRPGQYNVGSAIPVSLAVVVCEFEMNLSALLSDLERSSSDRETKQALNRIKDLQHKIRKTTTEWFSDYSWKAEREIDVSSANEMLADMDELACQSVPGARSRARLIRILYRHHFPALASMAAQKALIDDVLLDIDSNAPKKLLESRQNEALHWLQDLINREKTFDAPMHFTPAKLAETAALAVIFRGTDTFSNGQTTRDAFLGDAYKLLGRAHGSFSMGKEFYANINRLFYLYDDFNDRARHSAHAQSMMMADMLAIYGILVRDGDES